MTSARARRFAVLAGAFATLTYVVPFRSYGLNLEDEGVLLALIQRYTSGELPYADFVSGYTPGFFYVTGSMWRLTGDVPTFRTLLALVHALATAGLVALALRVSSPILALAVGLVCVAFLPVFPGEFCSFNVPYAAWFATLTWVATAVALVAFVDGRRRAWLVVAGAAAAAAFAVKPNAGVFALAASVATLLVVARPTAVASAGSADAAVSAPGVAGGRLSILVWWACWSVLLAGTWLTIGTSPSPRDMLVYLGPVSAAFLVLPTAARVRRGGLVTDLAFLGVGFAFVTLPWTASYWARLGPERFLHDVLYVGSEFQQIYYVPYPAFEPWALLVTAAAIGIAVAGLGLRGRWLRPLHVALLAVGALVAACVAIARTSVMPERTAWSIIWQLESAGFPLVLLAQVAGVVWLWRTRTRGESEVPATLLLCALFMHLQVFPRADFTHLVAAMPLTAVFAAFLLEGVLAWWRMGLPAWLARGVVPAAAMVLFAVIVVRVTPGVTACARERGPALPFAIAPIGVERERAADLIDLGTAATRLGALVPPGQASLAFPAVDVALMLTRTRNPTPHSYFFPGRPGHLEEAEIVDALAVKPPAAAFSLNAGFTFFDAAPPYYFLLRRFVSARYRLVERDGRFDVLARAEPPSVSSVAGMRTPADVPRSPHPDAGGSLAAVAPALVAEAGADDVVVRRAALRALIEWLVREPANGLETWVAGAGFDRRREILLLRTVRDLREPRAASYLFAAAARADGRIANEALGAMYVTRAQMIARRHLWAGAIEPAVWPGREALAAAVRRVLGDMAAPARATAFAAEVAGALGDATVAPLLRARLDGDAATAASAAAALARLAPGGLACDLLPLLARPELEIQALVPSTLLALAETPAPIGGEARECLARGIARPGAGRESAVWTAAALGDPTFAPALRAALDGGEPSVRRAAAWALGEVTPADVASRAALSTAAARDDDATVRHLAARALDKQDGRTPSVVTAAGLVG